MSKKIETNQTACQDTRNSFERPKKPYFTGLAARIPEFNNSRRPDLTALHRQPKRQTAATRIAVPECKIETKKIVYMSTKTEKTGTAGGKTLRIASRISAHQSMRSRTENERNTITRSGRTTSASEPSAAKHTMPLRPPEAVQSSTIPSRHTRKGVGQESDGLKEAARTDTSAIRHNCTAMEGVIRILGVIIIIPAFALGPILDVAQKIYTLQAIQATVSSSATAPHAFGESPATIIQRDGEVTVYCDKYKTISVQFDDRSASAFCSR